VTERPERPELDVEAALRLPPSPHAAGQARTFIADFCSAAQLPAQTCQDAALLVSELVTNAVIHGRTSATVEVHRPADTLRVTVRDDNPQLPAVGDAPDLNAESGRGLLIVSKTATRWGIEAGEGGKAIWFELAVDRD
jgi:anti-sigma regulatory factor (Ser/Thr protein kinase)